MAHVISTCILADEVSEFYFKNCGRNPILVSLNCIQESVVNPSSASRIEKNIINAMYMFFR